MPIQKKITTINTRFLTEKTPVDLR